MASSSLLSQISSQFYPGQSQVNNISEREQYWKNKMVSQQALYNSNHQTNITKSNKLTYLYLIYGVVFIIIIMLLVYIYYKYIHNDN
jgi:uncharacterized membrane protein